MKLLYQLHRIHKAGHHCGYIRQEESRNMAFALACCSAVLPWEPDLWHGLAGMECNHWLRGFSFGTALRVAVEVAPAEVTAAVVAVAADTENIVARAGTGLLEMMLVVEFYTVDQKANIDSEEAGP